MVIEHYEYEQYSEDKFLRHKELINDVRLTLYEQLEEYKEYLVDKNEYLVKWAEGQIIKVDNIIKTKDELICLKIEDTYSQINRPEYRYIEIYYGEAGKCKKWRLPVEDFKTIDNSIVISKWKKIWNELYMVKNISVMEEHHQQMSLF